MAEHNTRDYLLHLAVPPDRDNELLAERIDDAETNAVEPAADGVACRVATKLTAGMENLKRA